jgi:hypothetical protein
MLIALLALLLHASVFSHFVYSFSVFCMRSYYSALRGSLLAHVAALTLVQWHYEAMTAAQY